MKRMQVGRAALSAALALSVLGGNAMAAPAYVLGHGPVSVWDYHLTNYDAEGNVRVRPSKTTFSLSGQQQDSGVPAYYSPDAELRENGSGTVLIQFNYNTDEEKAWFDAIAEQAGSVQLVAYNENRNPLNDSLNFSKQTGIAHGGGTIAQLSIPLGQANFFSNGRYYVRVKSAGHDTALIPIHVVNEKAPSMKLTGSGAVRSGQNVHFAVSDMVYGVTVPAYQAELTGPDGKTEVLEIIEDWYLIGDTFVLYNDNENHIPYTGNYTLTVHSNGFKDMSYIFSVIDGADAPAAARARGIDALSRATSGGSSGGSSGEGGSATMSADLLFDGDLLINALIFDRLGVDNAAATGIAERWEAELSGYDAVWDESGEVFYDWADYLNAVQQAKLRGEYLTFAEYSKTGAHDPNRPYAVKEVLEDNLLGETQYHGSYKGMTPPEMTLVDADGKEIDVVPEGSDLILQTDAGYLSKLTSVNLGGNSLDLDDSKWTVDGGRLTISRDALTLGANRIVLSADGYRDNYLNVTYQKQLESVSLSTQDAYALGDAVTITVNGSDGDFLANLTAVELVTPSGQTKTVLPKGSGGLYDNDCYIKANTSLSIQSGAFEETGSYTATLTAQYYGARWVTFTVNGTLPAAPVQNPTGSVAAGVYALDFGTDAQDWQRKAQSVTVNGNAYTASQNSVIGGSETYYWSTSGAYGPECVLKLGSKWFTKETGNEVVIRAAGYQPLTVLVDQDGNVTSAGGSEEPEQPEEPAKEPPEFQTVEFYDEPFGDDYYRVSFNADEDTLETYLKAINGETAAVTINETKCNYTSFFWQDENAFTVSGRESYGGAAYIDFTADCFADPNTSYDVVVQVAGYKDLTFTVQGGGADEEQPGEPTATAPEVSSVEFHNGLAGNNYYRVSFDATEETLEAYLGAINGESAYSTVNGNRCTYTSSFWGDTNSFKVSNHDNFGWAAYLDFTADCFAGEGPHTVVVHVDGYKDLAFTVESGALKR